MLGQVHVVKNYNIYIKKVLITEQKPAIFNWTCLRCVNKHK